MFAVVTAVLFSAILSAACYAYMLTCKGITELVTDFLEGRLTLVQRPRFHFHVGMCRHCRAYLRQLRATVLALALLPAQPVPPDLPAEILGRCRNWTE